MAAAQRNTKNKYSQNAYEYDRNAVRVPVPVLPENKPERFPQRVSKPGEKVQTRPQQQKQRKVSIIYIILVFVGSLVLGNIITMNSEITDLSLKTHVLKKDMERMEKECSNLKYELNNQMTAQELDQYAKEKLGMIKYDANNVVFLKYVGDDSFESQVEKHKTKDVFSYLYDGIKEIAVSVWEYIN